MAGEDTQKDQAGAAPRARRWRRLVFGASLALNAFLIALMAGMFFAGPERRGGPPEIRALRMAASEAPAELEKTVRAQMRDAFRRMTPYRERLNAARRAVADAARAAPFEPEALDAAMEELASAIDARARFMRAEISAIVGGTLDAAARARFAEALAIEVARREERLARRRAREAARD